MVREKHQNCKDRKKGELTCRGQNVLDVTHNGEEGMAAFSLESGEDVTRDGAINLGEMLYGNINK